MSEGLAKRETSLPCARLLDGADSDANLYALCCALWPQTARLLGLATAGPGLDLNMLECVRKCEEAHVARYGNSVSEQVGAGSCIIAECMFEDQNVCVGVMWRRKAR